MSALAQTSSGDLDLSTGNLAIVQDIPTVTAQKLNNLFKFFLGEYFADSRLGVPYFQFVLVRNPDLNVIRRIFQNVIQSVPEVTQILDAQVTYVSRTRQASAVFRIQVDGGAILTGGMGVPFVVSTTGAPS